MKKKLDKFIMYLQFERHFSKNTISSYKNDIQKYFIYLDKKCTVKAIDKIKNIHIRSYLKYLRSLGQKPSSINRNISSIRQFHLYALENEMTTHNPSDLIDSLKTRRIYPDTLNVEEIDLILNSVNKEVYLTKAKKNDILAEALSKRDLSIISLLYSSGIRVTELISIKISDINIKESYMRVLGKGKKERFVPLGKKAINSLLIYLKKSRNIISSNNSGEGFLYLSNRSKPLTRLTINNLIKKYCKLANINRKISPHTFRHSFATHMLEGGADLRVVQEILGHENINTTEIYTHLDRTYLKEIHKLHHPRG